MRLRFLFVYTCIIVQAQTRTKTWICNTNADDPKHWVGGDYMKNCNGFYFPESFKDICLMSIGNLKTNAIYLPIEGDVVLRDDADVTFSEDSDNCVMVRDDVELRNFRDPQCWENENEAIPDVERAPCADDVVVFPRNASYNIINDLDMFPVGYFVVRGEKMDITELYIRTIKGDTCREFDLFLYRHFSYNYYKDKNSCQERVVYEFACHIRDFWRKIVCSNPVSVTGHCTFFCGSVFRIKPKKDFDINKFFNALTKDQVVDAYYSIIDRENKIYQVTLTDKGDFVGDSIWHAQKFYDQIKSDLNAWAIQEVTATFSGFAIDTERNYVQHAMGILFGTLFAVALLFAVVFSIYVGPLQNLNLLERLPLNMAVRRSTKPFVFARFENKNDGGMSMGGSIASLDEAFDNPMYGQPMASTSSANILQTVEESEEIKEGNTGIMSESEFTNPIFDEDKIIVELVED